MCNTFKVKSLKTPKLDVPPKKTACNLFYKGIQEKKEELKGANASNLWNPTLVP